MDIIRPAIRVVRHIRSTLSNPVIVEGGAHPTLMPRHALLDCAELDVVDIRSHSPVKGEF